MTDQLAAILKCLHPFTDEELRIIIPRFKPKTAKRNTLLVRQGDICKEFFFVLQGCIRLYFIDRKGIEKTSYIMPINHIGTSMASFIAQTPSFEFVDALNDSELMVVSHHDFYALNEDLPAWGIFYQKILEMAFTFQTRKIESIVTLNAQQRFNRALKETPALIPRVSNRILASYLDITPETLSRLKKKKTLP